MQTFSYKARDSAGKLVIGKIEADNRNQAIAFLQARSYFLSEMKEAPLGGTCSNLEKILMKRVSSRELSIMCRHFSTLFQAGVPILQCINILIQQSEHKTLRESLTKVTAKLKKGASLTDSFGSFPNVFPPIFISMLEAGEVGGALGKVLDRLAATFEREHYVREKIKTAMIYPAVVLIISILSVIFLLIYVIPNFVTMLTEMDAPIPVPTQIIILSSTFLKNYWYLGLFLVTGTAVGCKVVVNTKRGRAFKDRLALQLPVFGPLIQIVIISRFCRSFSSLLRSGVPVMQALGVIKNIVGNSMVVNSVKAAEESIKQGGNLSQPLQQDRIFPPMVTRMIAVGEETGALDSLMEKAADFYEIEVEYQFNRLGSILEPMLIVGTGGMVGFIILSILMPVFSIINNVK